ncbi:MAG: DUF72 domain-containing protein [Vicinamibacterales bacterium]
MAVLAPMPKASVTSVARVKAGVRRSRRPACRTSRITSNIQSPSLTGTLRISARIVPSAPSPLAARRERRAVYRHPRHESDQRHPSRDRGMVHSARRGTENSSSFHRPHATATYAKWRLSTPASFQFAVKMPRSITHDLKLRNAQEPLSLFLDQSAGLADKRGPILIQLPPSLAFDLEVVTTFLDLVRRLHDGPLVCEPRHASWFSPAVSSLLDHYRTSRVAADPPPVPEASVPGGWPGLVYFRLHGSPRTYWARYGTDTIEALARSLRDARTAAAAWCVFDNTAGGFAIENALELQEATKAYR